MRQKAGRKREDGQEDGCTYQLDILGLPESPSAERYLDDNNHTPC